MDGACSDTARESRVAATGRAGYRPGVAHTYPPLNVEVRTPRLTLAGASDELLERLVPLVRAGIADAEPWPFGDPDPGTVSPLLSRSPGPPYRKSSFWAERAVVTLQRPVPPAGIVGMAAVRERWSS